MLHFYHCHQLQHVFQIILGFPLIGTLVFLHLLHSNSYLQYEQIILIFYGEFQLLQMYEILC